MLLSLELGRDFGFVRALKSIVSQFLIIGRVCALSKKDAWTALLQKPCAVLAALKNGRHVALRSVFI